MSGDTSTDGQSNMQVYIAGIEGISVASLVLCTTQGQFFVVLLQYLSRALTVIGFPDGLVVFVKLDCGGLPLNVFNVSQRQV